MDNQYSIDGGKTWHKMPQDVRIVFKGAHSSQFISPGATSDLYLVVTIDLCVD